MRTWFLVATVVVCDIVMVFLGVPLVRATWLAITQSRDDRHLLIMLLAANLTLMCIACAGFGAAAVLSARGVRFVFTRFARAYERPTQGP